MAYCHKCGKKSGEEDSFCENCGAKINGVIEGIKEKAEEIVSVQNPVSNLISFFYIQI